MSVYCNTVKPFRKYVEFLKILILVPLHGQAYAKLCETLELRSLVPVGFNLTNIVLGMFLSIPLGMSIF